MCSRGCCILTDHKWKWHAQFIALHFEDWMICPTCLCQCQVWWWHVVSLLNNSMKPITHSVRWKSYIQHYTTPWNTHKNNLYTRLLIWYITVWLCCPDLSLLLTFGDLSDINSWPPFNHTCIHSWFCQFCQCQCLMHELSEGLPCPTLSDRGQGTLF